MKKTLHANGHRWTTEELRQLMLMWACDATVEDIGEQFGVTRYAVLKMIQKLRSEGVPLRRRVRGNRAGRHGLLWSQGEVEYLMRRRQEKATMDSIGLELGRTFSAVQGMIQTLRRNGVDVPMLGCGVRRLWDPSQLQAMARAHNVFKNEEAARAARRRRGLK